MSEGPVPTIAVRGSSTVEVVPELARVNVTVGARAADRATALRDLTRRADDVRTALAAYGEAVEAVDTGTLWARPQFRDGKPRERVTGYAAGVDLTVTVIDFGVLGDLLLRLADREMVSVRGPFWALRPESDVYRRARTDAVRDARRRAEEYAAAAGARLTGLVEIADVGLSGPQGGPVAPAPAAFRALAAGSVADQVSFDVEPVSQTVHASVEARFTATQPDF
jgi:uncharacterized protein YggE